MLPYTAFHTPFRLPVSRSRLCFTTPLLPPRCATSPPSPSTPSVPPSSLPTTPNSLLPLLQSQTLPPSEALSLWRHALSDSLQSRDIPNYLNFLHLGVTHLPTNSLPLPILIPFLLHLANLRKWQPLFSLLALLTTRPPAQRPDQRLLVSLANLAIEKRNYAICLRLLHMVSDNGMSYSSVAWSVLLKLYGRTRNAVMVRSVAQQALDGRVDVDAILLNSAIDALVRVGYVDSARRIVARESLQSVVDVRTLNILVKGLCAQERVDEAFSVVEEMHGSGITSNVVTRNTLVAACAGRGDFERAKRLVRKGEGKQNRIGMTALVGGLARNGRGGEAMRLVGEMGEGVGETTYAVLIGGLLRGGKAEEARKVFEEGGGGKKGRAAYVGGLCSRPDVGWVERGAAVVERMLEEAERKVDVELCNLVLGGYVRVGRFANAEQFLGMMEQKGVAPNVISYTIMMRGYLDARMYWKSRKMFQVIPKRGIKPDRVALGMFVSTCAKLGDVEAGERVVEFMEQKGGLLSPGIEVYAPLMGGYARLGESAKVWEVYERMREKRVILSGEMLEVLTGYVVRIRIGIGRGEVKKVEMDEIARRGAQLLRDGYKDEVDGKVLRKCRRKMLEVFMETRAKRHFRGLDSPEMRSASERIFERHGWNEFDSRWRVI